MSRPRELESRKVGEVEVQRRRHKDGRNTIRLGRKTLTLDQASELANVLMAMVLRGGSSKPGSQ